jgi:PAS domain S-box-containing protein/diguanylate cyclase (GGDEF)-like protein
VAEGNKLTQQSPKKSEPRIMESNVLKGRSKSERPSVENLAIRIVFLYASLSSLWMLFTDRLLAAQSYELTGLAWPVAVQGWGFVLVTSGLLYLLMRQSVRTQQEKCGVLHSVIESTTDAIFVKDLQGRYFTVNSAGASLLGKPVEEVLGRDDTELFPPETAREIIESDRRVIALSETKTYEECATLKTSGRTFLTTKSACRNPQGNVIGVICRAHEITDRLQTEQALRETDHKLQALIQAAPVAINILDLQGKVQLWNPAAERIFGLREPEVKGRPLLVVPKDKLDELRGVLETVFQGEARTGWETQRRRKDGTLIDVSISTAPLRDANGKIAGAMGIVADITERKTLERERERLIEQLRRETEDLAALSAVTANGISTLNLEELLDVLLGRILEVMRADFAAILLKEDDHLYLSACAGLEGSAASSCPYDGPVKIGQGFAGTIAALEQPLYIEDAQTDPIASTEFIKQLGIRSMLGVPLKRNSTLLGVLHIDWHSIHPCSERQTHLLEITAERCAMAILNAQLFEKTKQLQEHLQLQIDRMPVGCIVHDSEFRITDWNPAAERIFGFTKAEVQGTVPDRLVPEAVRLDLDSLKQRLKEGDMTAHSLNENLTKDGRTIICEWHNTPLKQADGTVTGVLSMVAEVTDRVRAIEQLRESEERFRTMADSAPMLLWLSDSDGLCTFFNQTWLKFTGRTLEQEIGNGWAEGVHPEDVRCCLQTYMSAFQARESFQMEYRLRRADGEYRWILDAGTPRFTPGGSFVGYIGCAIDITDRKRASEAVRESEARYRHLIESTIEGVWVVDAEDKTVFVNRQMAEMLGYTPEEMQGQPLLAFLDEESLPLATAGSSRRRQGIQERQDFKFRRKDGSELWAIVSTNPIFDAAGNCAGALSAITDITERKRVEEKLQYYAFYDPLTGLPNRALFQARAGELISRASLGEGGLFAVLFLDLERFGIVKYTLGHLVADKLLIATARRLEGCLRPTDTAARVGSDEFAILLTDIQDVSQALSIAERIYQQLALPFDLDGREVFSTTSIGIALSWRDEHLAHTQSIASCRDAIYRVSNRVSNRVFEPENPNSQLPTLIYDQPEDILRDADTAMHHAKVHSQAHCAVFHPAMHSGALTRLQLESDLQRAIQRQQFQVYYQPIVSLATLRIVGFEALVRWEHPSRGMVSPGEFIPLAEETGLITFIDLWVLREACWQLGVWQRAFPAPQPLMISVNLSGVQLGQLGMIERLDQILRETGIDGGSLKLEITESAFMENTAAEIGMLEQLKALGIQLSIDDFGTGYSSLARLHQLPVDTLKIDRSFVSRMTADGDNSEIVHTIVRLAHTLGMDAVAEGVETPEQLEILRTLQCEYGQGYFFSKPVDSDAARALLLSERFPNQNN